jgi:hypothetical protein
MHALFYIIRDHNVFSTTYWGGTVHTVAVSGDTTPPTLPVLKDIKEVSHLFLFSRTGRGPYSDPYQLSQLYREDKVAPGSHSSKASLRQSITDFIDLHLSIVTFVSYLIGLKPASAIYRCKLKIFDRQVELSAEKNLSGRWTLSIHPIKLKNSPIIFQIIVENLESSKYRVLTVLTN